MDNTGTGGGFLGGLSDIALGYLQTRANILLNNQAGGQVPTQYIGGSGSSSPTPTLSAGSTLLHSPLLWIAAGGLLFVAVLLVAGKKK